MDIASTRFFDMPELVALIAVRLDHKEISRLLRTNKQMYDSLIAPLLHTLQINYNPSAQPPRSGRSDTHAGKEHSPRKATCHDLDRVAYVVNCNFAFQDQIASSTDTPPSRATWLAPPDPEVWRLLPLSILTTLTSLNLCYERKGENLNCPFRMESYYLPRAALAQTCFIMENNPGLTELKLDRIVLKDNRDTSLLVTTISGLRRLSVLWMSAVAAISYQPCLGIDFVFSAPSSVTHLQIETSDFSMEDDSVPILDYLDDEDGKVREPWDMDSDAEVDNQGVTTETRIRSFDERGYCTA
jgi:hypothetical protein